MLEAGRERPVRERGIRADDLEEGVFAEPGDRAARAEILMAARSHGAHTRPRLERRRRGVQIRTREQQMIESSPPSRHRRRAYPDVSAIAPPGRLA